MVNLGLNFSSLLGIILAIAGAGLYFLRIWQPKLARDHDIFFAAIGLLCGGILLFQGWRLDPILAFGQFLLAGSAVFFAVESIRMRGLVTTKARERAPVVDEERYVSDVYRVDAELDDDRPIDEYMSRSRQIRGRSNRIEDYEDDSYRRRPSRSERPERVSPDGYEDRSPRKRRPRNEPRLNPALEDDYAAPTEREPRSSRSSRSRRSSRSDDSYGSDTYGSPNSYGTSNDYGVGSSNYSSDSYSSDNYSSDNYSSDNYSTSDSYDSSNYSSNYGSESYGSDSYSDNSGNSSYGQDYGQDSNNYSNDGSYGTAAHSSQAYAPRAGRRVPPPEDSQYRYSGSNDYAEYRPVDPEEELSNSNNDWER
ncbi:MAG: Ycf66 family protein [Microcoleaceae cyanobacterium]